MKKTNLYTLWAFLYILCAGLGFIPEPQGGAKAVMVLLAAAFFIPGSLILYRAIQRRDLNTIRLVRNLALLSLFMTLVTLIVNILSVRATDLAGQVLFGLLVLVSSPMVCGQYYALSLFLWACLMVVSMKYLRKWKK